MQPDSAAGNSGTGNPGTGNSGKGRRPVRIGNSSGFFGDRMEAAWEMVEGGPVDILTGDYLAELTMLILFKARQKDPAAGYAASVLSQLEHVLGTCLDRGIKIVNNAGGLNPAGLAAALEARGRDRGGDSAGHGRDHPRAHRKAHGRPDRGVGGLQRRG